METLPSKNDTEEVSNVITPPVTCIPPRILKRNEHGLICDGVNYVYNDDGFINWRKMVKPEHLVIKKDNFERKNRPVPASVEECDDKDLLILLGGIKELAQVRGFSKVIPVLTTPAQGYVAAVCSITWIPNYETEGREVVFSGCGDAHAGSTNDLTRPYLATIAENRAFVRAVRNFLKIPILGQDEIPTYSSQKDTATSALEEVMSQYGVTFEVIKKKLVDEGVAEAANYTDVDSLPRFKKFELIERIKKKAAERGV